MKLVGRGSTDDVRSTGFEFCVGDTLYGRLRPYLNKVFVAGFDGLGSGEFIVFPPTSAFAPAFLAYLLNQSEFVSFTGTLDSGDRPRVRWDQIRAFEFGLPPVPVQHEIVAAIETRFSHIDAGVESIRASGGRLDRLQAAILQVAMTGQVSYAGAPTSAALPPSWSWLTPDELAADRRNALTIGPFGSSLKVSDYTSDGVPLVFVRQIRRDSFGGSETRYVSIQKAKQLSAHQVLPGDVLITKMGDPPGDVAVYPRDQLPGVVTADVIKLTPREGILPSYLALAFRSRLVRSQFQAITSGVAQQKVSLARFRRSLRVPVPPTEEQSAIVDTVNRQLTGVDRVAGSLVRQIERAALLRASVLQAAFDGSLLTSEGASM